MYANHGFGSIPGGQPPESGAQPPQPGPPPRGGRRVGKVAALVVTCAVVAGGAYAVTEAVTGPGTPAASTTASGPTGQAAILNGALADASSVSASTSGTSAANSAAVRRLGRALIRLRRLGGMYGQFTFETKTGPRTLAFERGTILSIAGSDVTVKASNGATETWVLTGTTIVRENGSRTSSSSLADGQLVFTAGPVSGATRDARLVVIRSAAKSQSANQSA